ncbi:uncharacterized protein [Symphalangus syndactylus]|uniref:uncharacterized protein n=1 Tax=Symphalangus syndactylus TaxID=9590 RepID=UPI003005E199
MRLLGSILVTKKQEHNMTLRIQSESREQFDAFKQAPLFCNIPSIVLMLGFCPYPTSSGVKGAFCSVGWDPTQLWQPGLRRRLGRGLRPRCPCCCWSLLRTRSEGATAAFSARLAAGSERAPASRLLFCPSARLSIRPSVGPTSSSARDSRFPALCSQSCHSRRLPVCALVCPSVRIPPSHQQCSVPLPVFCAHSPLPLCAPGRFARLSDCSHLSVALPVPPLASQPRSIPRSRSSRLAASVVCPSAGPCPPTRLALPPGAAPGSSLQPRMRPVPARAEGNARVARGSAAALAGDPGPQTCHTREVAAAGRLPVPPPLCHWEHPELAHPE